MSYHGFGGQNTSGGGGAATQLDADGTILDVNAISNGEFLKRVGATVVSSPAAGGGDVVGPAGVLADNALVRWDLTTGKLVQDSNAILSDAGALTLAGVLVTPLGSVGAPSHTFAADLNTGVYSPAGDTVAVTAGGVEQVRWAAAQTLPPLGSAAAPSYSYIGDVNTGAFSSAPDTYDIATGGTSRFTLSTTGLTLTLPLVVPLGAVGAPSCTFVGDLDTGAYSSAANTYDVATGGTNRLSIASTGATFGPVILGPAGAIGAPTFAYAADPNSGHYSSGADQVSLSLNGAEAYRWTTTQQMNVGLGTASAPALSFTTDPNSGVFASAADTIDISTGGTSRVSVSTTILSSTLVAQGPAGVAGTPTWSFTTDPDCGMYNGATNQINFSTNAVSRLAITTSLISSTVQFLGPIGSVSNCTYQFTADGNTGVFSPGADIGALAAGGTERFRWDGTGLSFFAGTTAAKQTVTGSRATGAATGSLLTALALYGLITDSSSA